MNFRFKNPLENSQTNSENSIQNIIPAEIKVRCSLLKDNGKNSKLNTRYYYKTFDSSKDSIKDFSYSAKREYDSFLESWKYVYPEESTKAKIGSNVYKS